MADRIYKVTLPRSFGAEQRVRAGITVGREAGYEGPLTPEQLKAIRADKEFTVKTSGADVPEADVVDGPTTDMSREELNAMATAEGVEAPDQLANKQAVVDAITAQRNATQE
jgi:hypothetical protein